MTDAFVAMLRAAADVLGPFAESPKAGSLRWNGKAYVPVSPPEEFNVDPYAAKWWATLTTVAGMLDGLDHVPPSQGRFLNHLLFGGPGSLGDFVLDGSVKPDEADQANQELVRLRASMYEEFKRVCSTPNGSHAAPIE